ncbi:LTA synthase family protein [Tenuifilum sp.]|uniref:LTA synthase family protein n=1 Tax=Tenuifilum sp. TaxID=2760880 RepID=UPI001B532F6C|nr:LTA synthase family protein [Bacteroidales bacterium]HOK60635.1 LTA synthase family protein [Tenuifilum sp.]MBP9028860.1 LTA synthase family protein [Bacteroidales bacterium]HOK85833.1 LTA synthase family protein [Tenuifilum sp.]HON69705.1 LTA synthase family protein [Tenuifilum sp.]
MRKHLSFSLRYFVFWVILFSTYRIAFLIYQFENLKSVKFNEFINIFIRGAWMDSSLAGYILLLTFLLLAIFFWVSPKSITRMYNALTILLLLVVNTVVISDMELYRNWGYRIDATPLLYLKTPKEAMASVKTPLLILFVVLLIGITYLTHLAYRKWVARELSQANKARWWYSPIYIFLAATMIIPIRGGFGIAPINPGKVYFSQNNFCNHAALNPVWNMMYSVSKSSSMSKTYNVEIDKATAHQRFGELMHTDSTLYVLNTNQPNIIIILLESFGAKLVGPLGGLPNVTPNLNRLASEGILFTRTTASGDRSDKGIIAVLSGFPAQPTQSVIKYPTKSNKLPTISEVLYNQGYSTAFYYGGDPDFANIRSFLYHAKFQRLITQDDFPKSYRNSKWGVHDEHVFNYLLTDIDSAKAPFFKMFFTLSSHEPFEIPAKPKFNGKTEVEQFLSSAYYADSCLGDFIAKAQQREWFKNTLIVLIADHGHRHPANHPNWEPLKFGIPMVWLGGVVERKPLVVTTTCSQTDLATTLLAQLKLPHDQFTLSKNILASKVTPFAYFAFNEGFGYVNQTDTIVYDLVGKKYIKQTGKNISETRNDAWAFFNAYQEVFQGL